MIKILLCFLLLAATVLVRPTAASAAPPMKYIHLEGSAPGVSGADVIQKLTTLFIAPLNTGSLNVRTTYSMTVSGPQSEFAFNLILEVTGVDSYPAFEQYIQDSESRLVFGVSPRFKNVLSLEETAEVQIGSYDPNAWDAFVVTYTSPRNLVFKTLLNWNNFTNAYGNALMSTDHMVFQSYVLSLISGLPEETTIVSELSKNDMMAINPLVQIRLEDGSVVGQDWNFSPFIPYKFIRSCFSSRLENGNCF